MWCHYKQLTFNILNIQVIPIQCLREISTGLPVTGTALSKVEHMTGHRMKHYQEVILSVTKEFQKKRLEHLARQVQARQEELEDEDFAPSTTTGGGSSDGWLGRNQGAKGGGGGKSAYFKKTGVAQKRKQTKQTGNSPKRKSVVPRSNNTGSMGLPKPRY